MILVLNCGSQSIKWKLFNEKLKPVKEGSLIEDLSKLTNEKIDLIGHRVVHGGGKFVKPLKITNENLAELEKISYLAPLHNPYNILGIKACQKIFNNIPQIAVFDTEFFADLPEVAKTYALPENLVKEFVFKRYGFHGISHEYVAKKTKGNKIITVHLGGGASITAIKNGKVIDTSMGFTPLEGLVMMTRSGNIDAGIVLEICRKYGVEKTSDILNKESGVKGICGEGEMLEVLRIIKDKPASAEASARQRKAKLALDVFVYSIKKYIGAYYAILGGCDTLVFTGAIGAGSSKIRNMICKDLDILKKAKILAIKTDEELAIAQKII